MKIGRKLTRDLRWNYGISFGWKQEMYKTRCIEIWLFRIIDFGNPQELNGELPKRKGFYWQWFWGYNFEFWKGFRKII